MIKGLLALDENLASSIALRYAARMIEILPLQLQAGHVESQDEKQHSGGSGWVRRTWEREIKEAGHQSIQRLLNTEKVPCPFIGPLKVFVGDRDDRILEELRKGNYDLFMEGNLNTPNSSDFHSLIRSRLYAKTACPVLVIKNLVATENALLLCGDGVDHTTIIPRALRILDGGNMNIDLLLYRYQENDEPVFMNKNEAGSTLAESEALLAEHDVQPASSLAVSGTPEKVAELLKKYSVVFSSFPTRKTPRLELLAHCPSPVLLIKQTVVHA